MWKVQLFKLNFDEKETAAVVNVLKSGWLTMGEKTREFETQFSSFLNGDVSSTAVANGTAALHLALLALGIGPGDEVILPSLTFVADINVITMVGATPVIADCVSYEDWNIDPEDILRKITPDTKAVMVVHFGGYPCDMDAIINICHKHNLRLIEDCAHSPGATYKGKHTGTFGDVGCFSFFSNKNLSIGEGGMTTTWQPDIDKKLKLLRSHGMTTNTLDRYKGRAISYDVVQPGLNYRMDEMRAALGLVQLSKLAKANSERKNIVERYISELEDIEGLVIPFKRLDYAEGVHHIFTVLLPDYCSRENVINTLHNEGVQSSIHYAAFDSFTAYQALSFSDTPVSSEISRRALTLPLYPTMTPNEIDIVISAFRKAVTLAKNS